ncbi:hypothetical protein lerEdw1_016743 [Lerista edwardsae]|nr:hypothetical protein lerEdw1_016743 [Lerista edwardsae]
MAAAARSIDPGQDLVSVALDPEIVVVVAEVELVEEEEEVAGSVIEGGQEIAKDLDDSEPCHFYLVC